MSGRHFLVLLAAVLLLGTASAGAKKKRSDSMKPTWITELPRSGDSDVLLVQALGEGSTLDTARQGSLVNLVNKLECEHGLTISGLLTSREEHESSGSSLGGKWKTSETFTCEVRDEGKRLNLTTRAVDEYWEKEDGEYMVWVLYSVRTDEGSMADPAQWHRFPVETLAASSSGVTVTERYGFAPVAMSIIPGVGQWYKGSRVKGTAFFLAEAAAVASIVVCENQRASYHKKMLEQPKFAKHYSSKASDWETGRNISIGVAAGIWVWNIIDAAVAKGARKVKFTSQNGEGLQLRPYWDGCETGLALTYSF